MKGWENVHKNASFQTFRERWEERLLITNVPEKNFVCLDQRFLTFFLQFPLASVPTLHFPRQHWSLTNLISAHEVLLCKYCET